MNRKRNKKILFFGIFVFINCQLPTAYCQLDSVGSLKSGIAQFQQGNYEGAEVELMKAVELNPKNPDAFFYLAETAFILNEMKKAMENYNKTIELNSKNAKAYKGRGKVKAKLEDFNGSIEDFTKAIEINPQGEYFYHRSLCYYRMGDIAKAKSDALTAVQKGMLLPESYKTMLQLGK